LKAKGVETKKRYLPNHAGSGSHGQGDSKRLVDILIADSRTRNRSVDAM
jgi:hypothetical protein